MAARTSLKLRMAAVVAVAALALLVLLVTGAITSARVEDHLASIRGNHLPRIGLQPRLEGHFERIGRGLQDAVAASDVDMLADTRQLADRFTGELAAAGDAVDPQAAAALRQAVADYYGAAYRVSERLIAGETGEALIDAIADMQERQGRAAERLKQATEIDQDGLARSFAAARQAQREATRIQLVVSGVCLLLVIVLSVGISRSILRSVSDLTAGFARFGDGDFSRPIPTAADELGEVARQANHMAERLDRLRSERDRIDRDLRQKNEELTRAAAELSRASTYKSQFLANMSHELRTPLNAILGFAELLHDGAVSPDSPEHKEFLGDILTSGRHLLQLINDVLDLSKVEAGKLEFRPEEAELGRLIGEVVAILRTTAAEKRIRIATEVAPEVDRVTLDPARLKQVLYNYVSNALKFTPEGGRVAIRALPEGDERFRLEVEDTGIGVAEEDLPRLFVEFQQIDGGAARRQSGTGLGLALTRRLVEAQGGSVGVKSTPGEGSTFHAVLPRRSQATRPAAPPARQIARPGAPSVLVIEDGSADQEQLVSVLSGAGYAVEVATTGAQALARCREQAFDAITLDLLLPDMSGLEVLQKIRQDGRNREVPVVVVTVIAERGALAGFAVSDILPKPVEQGALLAALERAGVPPHRGGAVLVVDDDPGSLRLMAATLERLGYATRCETGGESALRVAAEAPPRAVILDLVMPGMSGFEFLEHFRRDPKSRRVPVIIWTVKDLSEEELARLRASADAIVSKGEGGSAAVLAELSAFLPPASRSRAGGG